MDTNSSETLMPVALPGAGAVAPCPEAAVEVAGDPRGGRPSASGLERLCLCPGSWQAEASCPEEAESADAAAGSRLHLHMEKGTLPEDAAEAEAVAWCRRMEGELAAELLGDEASERREARLWARDRAFSGQPDAVFVAGDRALIVDYKFGRGEVASAPGNLQLAALAVLAGQALPQVSEVFAAILQPFVSRDRPQVVRYGREDLQAAEAYLARAIAAAEAPGAVLRWEALPPEARAELWRRAQLARRVADAVERRVKADLKNGAELPGLG